MAATQRNGWKKTADTRDTAIENKEIKEEQAQMEDEKTVFQKADEKKVLPKADKKPVPKLDTPGLTRQQKIWIAAGTIWWALRPLLLYLFLPTVFMMIGMTIRKWSGGTDAFAAASGNFYDTVGILCCFLLLKYLCEKKGENFSDAATFYWKHPDLEKTGNYMVLGVSLSIFLSAVLTVIPWFGGYAENAEVAFKRTDLLLALISVIFIAPVSEETIFRGLMLNRLLTQFSEKTAVVVTSALFAVCHVNPVWILYAFCMGILLCWVSLKEDNIFYGVVLHCAFNAPTVLNVLIRHWDAARELFYGNKLFIFCYGILAFLSLVLWIRRNDGFTAEFIRQFSGQKE